MATVANDDIVGMDWEEFKAYFLGRWEPGQHVACCGPTGVGKSTLVCHLLGERKYVLALDPKGGDSTLSTLEKRGFQRITSWPPPRKIREGIARGEPARLIVGHRITDADDYEKKLQPLLAKTLHEAFAEGGWTIYVDEMQVAADARMMNLTARIERNLIAARDRGISMVSSFQRPARVPRSAGDQSTYFVVWYTRDTDVVNRLAEMMGRQKDQVRGAVRALDRHDIVVVSNNPHDPMIFTHVPKF